MGDEELLAFFAGTFKLTDASDILEVANLSARQTRIGGTGRADYGTPVRQTGMADLNPGDAAHQCSELQAVSLKPIRHERCLRRRPEARKHPS